MSDTAIPEAQETAPSPEVSFADFIGNQIHGKQEPAAEPVKEEPKATPTDQPKPEEKQEPATPLEEIKSEETEKPDFSLPIDEEEQEPASTEQKEGEEIEDKTPAGRRFAQLKKENKEFQRQLAERDAKLAQYESKAKEGEGVNAELESLREKLSKYEAEISVVKIEQTEEWQEAVSKPLGDIFAASDAIAERYQIDPDKLAVAMEISDPEKRKTALREITSGIEVDIEDQVEIRDLSKRLQSVIQKKAAILDNKDAALAELQARRQQEAAADAAAKAEERRKTTSVVGKRIADKLTFVKDIPGVDYDAVTESVGKIDFDALPVHDKAYAQIAGALLPKLAKDKIAMQNQLDALMDELEAYKKASPNPGGGRPSTGDVGDDVGFLDSFKRKAYGAV